MRCFGVLALLLATLAAVAWAAGPAPELPLAEHVRRIQRDLELIETLVESGIELANEDDPLVRASLCNRLAERLTKAIGKAAREKDKDRVKELGQYLQEMLEGGVAGSLMKARADIPLGSPRERRLQEFGKQVQEMEEELDRTPDADEKDMKPALSAVRQGRAEVEKAIKGKDKPRDKDQGPRPQ